MLFLEAFLKLGAPTETWITWPRCQTVSGQQIIDFIANLHPQGIMKQTAVSYPIAFPEIK